MTREEAKRQIKHEDAIRPVKQAYADGKTIQLRIYGNVWDDMTSSTFEDIPENYRIKPEPFECKLWIPPSGVAQPWRITDNEQQLAISGWKLITVIEKP